MRHTQTHAQVPITEEGEGSKGGGSSMLLGAGGPQPLLRRLLRDSSALFDDHTKEAGDSLLQAFKSRTYSKVGVEMGSSFGWQE